MENRNKLGIYNKIMKRRIKKTNTSNQNKTIIPIGKLQSINKNRVMIDLFNSSERRKDISYLSNPYNIKTQFNKKYLIPNKYNSYNYETNYINKNNRFNSYEGPIYLQNSYTTIENNNERINNVILNKSVDSIELKSKELTNLNLILDNQNKKLRKSILNMKNKIRNLSSEKEYLKINNQELISQKNDILIAMNESKNKLVETENLSNNEIYQKNIMIKTLKNEINKLKKIIEQKNTEINKLKEINKINEVNKNNITDIKTLNSPNNNSEKNNLVIDNLINQITKLQNELKLAKKENEKNKKLSDINNTKKEITKYQMLYIKANKEKEEIKNYSNKISLQLNSLTKENQKLKNFLNNNNNNNNYEQELNMFKNELKIKINDINIYKNKNISLQKNIDEMNQDIKQKESQINILEKNILNYKSQIQDLTNINKNKKNNKYNEDNINTNNVILNLKAQISELENEQNNYIIQLSKIKDLENQVEKLKQENEINFNELKQKENENNKLIKIIKDKEKEIENLQNDYPRINMSSSQFVEQIDNNKNPTEEFKEKEELKKMNSNLIQENTQSKEKIELIKNENNEELILNIDNLKEELKDKKLQINNLIKENNNLKNFTKKSSISGINKLNSNELNDEVEVINLYKEQIKDLKISNESDKMQIKTLKEDIKDCKKKIKLFESFNGQLKDIDEFITLFNNALENYKPKKKEQKEALNKLIQVISNMSFE